MDLRATVKKAGQAIRVPMDVIRRRPQVIKSVLGLTLDLTKAQAETYTFFYGWADPKVSSIIIVAQGPEDGPPVLLECSRIRAYKTLVTVYEIKAGHALFL